MMGGLRTKANQLNSYFFHTGDPDSLQWDLDRYRQVTAEGVRAQAEATLEGSARIVLHIHPEEVE
jgi:predicted Zn-dependent peptidase